MIIKSLRHTQRNATYSVNYSFDGMSNDPENNWLIFRNISLGFDRQSIISEFNTNAEFLTKTVKRKKVFRYHEILSFSHEDSNSKILTREKLQKIANEYLNLRDPKGLSKVVCVPHIEEGKHYHIHILLTSNYLESSRSSDMRMNNERYYEIRRSMERTILRTMPELHRSTVYLKEQEIEQLLPERYKRKRRLLQLNKKPQKRNHKKERLAEMVGKILQRSTTLEEFENLLNEQSEFKTFSRNGKLSSIIYSNQKYRLKNLGLPLYQENFITLKRMNEIQRLDKGRDISDQLER